MACTTVRVRGAKEGSRVRAESKKQGRAEEELKKDPEIVLSAVKHDGLPAVRVRG